MCMYVCMYMQTWTQARAHACARVELRKRDVSTPMARF